MKINWVWFLLSILAAYVLYAALYIGAVAAFYPEYASWEQEVGRSFDDPLAPIAFVGHLGETVITVLLYHLFVASRSYFTGMAYGLMMGVYVASSQVVLLGSHPDWNPDIVLSAVPLHVLVGVSVGALLAALYRPAKSEFEASAEA